MQGKGNVASTEATALPAQRSLLKLCEVGAFTSRQGPQVIWQGMPPDLVALPELVARVWPRTPDILRRAVSAARCAHVADRGRQRGCTPCRIRWTERLGDRAFLGTPIYRLSYIKDGKERLAPGFVLKINALKAKELLHAKDGKADVGQ